MLKFGDDKSGSRVTVRKSKKFKVWPLEMIEAERRSKKRKKKKGEKEEKENGKFKRKKRSVSDSS